MGFTDLLSRLSSGKALPPSHYDEEFVVASIDKIQKILYNRTHSNPVDVNIVDRSPIAVNYNTFVNSKIPSRVENSSDVIGQDFSNRSLANFKLKIIVAIISCIARSLKICDNSHTRSENCTSKCLPIENSKFNFESITFFGQSPFTVFKNIYKHFSPQFKMKLVIAKMEDITSPSIIIPEEHNIALKF